MATNLTANPLVVGTPASAQSPETPAGALVPPATIELVPYRRVYVWELPVRIFHWLNALTILILALTGYLIGNPQTIFAAQEPYQQYWFGWVRFLHFATAYIFFFNIVFRIYWGFVGNEYANWRNYVLYRRDQMQNIWEVIETDVLQLRLHRKLFIGHNYMASFTYLMMLVLSVLQIITGFALYASTSEFFLPQLFAWAIPLLGGDLWVRQWHHIFMWAFVVFTIIHVYLVVYHDVFEGRGTMSSIIGGWTFMKDDEIK